LREAERGMKEEKAKKRDLVGEDEEEVKKEEEEGEGEREGEENGEDQGEEFECEKMQVTLNSIFLVFSSQPQKQFRLDFRILIKFFRWRSKPQKK
jgi:hypothetical protein